MFQPSIFLYSTTDTNPTGELFFEQAPSLNMGELVAKIEDADIARVLHITGTLVLDVTKEVARFFLLKALDETGDLETLPAWLKRTIPDDVEKARRVEAFNAKEATVIAHDRHLDSFHYTEARG